MGNFIYYGLLIFLFSANECNGIALTPTAFSSSNKYGNICNDLKNGFICTDCKTLVNCIDGEAFAETCRMGDTCLRADVFGKAVCQPLQHYNCACNSDNTFFVDAYDPQVFFYCDEVHSEPEMHHCQGDKEFDVQEQMCLSRSDLPQCISSGLFPDYKNCAQYYSCISTQDGWMQRSYFCGNGKMFNEETGKCEDPCNWPSGRFACQTEGRFSDPLSCENYYECVKLQNNSFRRLHQQCPRGHIWKQIALSGSGQCIKQTNGDCSPVRTSHCIIPEGLCTSDIPNEEMEAQINELKRKMTENEQQIKQVNEIIDVLKSVGQILGSLFLILENFPTDRNVKESYPDIIIEVNIDGTVTLSPYCGVRGKDTLTGSALDVLKNGVEDVQMTVTQSLDLLPCMRNVMGKLVNSIYDGEIYINQDLSFLNDLLIEAIQTITLVSNGNKSKLEKLVKERDGIESELIRLKHLETKT